MYKIIATFDINNNHKPIVNISNEIIFPASDELNLPYINIHNNTLTYEIWLQDISNLNNIMHDHISDYINMIFNNMNQNLKILEGEI